MMTMLAVYQQDAYAARCHFFSGYKLFKHWKAVDFDESPNARALELAFVQMHIHYTTSNNPRLFIDDQRLVIPEVTEISTNTFIRGDSMARAQGFAGIIPRMAMECLLYGGFCIGPARLPLGPGTPALFAMLRMWRSQLKAFSLQSGVLSEFDRDLLTLLELWSEIINIKLVVRDNSVPLEGTFDDHLEQFRSVIKMAGSLVEVNPTTLPAIFIKTSLVPALLYCGAKCRDSQIRDGVIRIIDGVKGKDPLISALLKALQKVTEYESKDVMLGDTIPEAARLGSVKLNIRPGQDQADLWYRRSRLDPHLHDDHGDWEHQIISI
jgi:hypothetical protein